MCNSYSNLFIHPAVFWLNNIPAIVMAVYMFTLRVECPRLLSHDVILMILLMTKEALLVPIIY